MMARGVRRQAIYQTEEDYLLFQKIVGNTKEIFSFQILAFCLMTNHFHMLIKTEEVEIWKIMNKIMNSYAKNFNGKYGYSGHLFDSRYISKVVEDSIYLAEVSRYIHLNPVRAGMVREASEYDYSSYKTYIGKEDHPLVVTEKIRGIFLYNPEEQYRRFVESGVDHHEMENRIQLDMKEDEYWLPW